LSCTLVIDFIKFSLSYYYISYESWWSHRGAASHHGGYQIGINVRKTAMVVGSWATIRGASM
jgi:hypothetical protein